MRPRKQPIPRRAPVKRTGRPTRKNVDRAAKTFARAYGSVERVEWTQRQPCVRCGNSPCEVAHTHTGGMGRKADQNRTIPLCPPCHRQLHQMGAISFEAMTHLDLLAESDKTQHAWKSSDEHATLYDLRSLRAAIDAAADHGGRT